MMNPMKALKEYNGLARKEAKNAYLTNLQARVAAFEEAAKIVEADGEASKGTLKKLNDLAQGAKQAVSYIEDYNKD